MRHYLDLLETLLNEAIVINPSEVDEWMQPLIDSCEPEAGKQWLKKRVRQYILNNEAMLVNVDDLSHSPYSSALRLKRMGENPESWPDYAQKAKQEGTPVFAFTMLNNRPLQDFAGHLKHLVDWFNALHMVSMRNATNDIETEDKVIATKELSKLQKYSYEMALQTADQWFNHMGSRAKNVKELDGVNIIAQLHGGFYVVEFTSEKAMMRDGHQLQNCLQQAYYWKQVLNGTMRVYSIRKANDEAVVGIRIVGDELAEVKGKNNKAVSPSYVPAVVEFLNKISPVSQWLTKIGVGSGGRLDLENSDIIVSTDGVFGSIDQLAKDIGEGVSAALVQSGGYVPHLWLRKGDLVVKLMTRTHVGIRGDASTAAILFVLNQAMKMGLVEKAFGSTNADAAADETNIAGIYYSPRGYGSYELVAKKMEGMPIGFAVYELKSKYKIVFDGELVLNINHNGQIEAGGVWLDGKVRKAAGPSISKIYNTLNITPSGQNYKLEEFFNTFWNGDKWGLLDQVALDKFPTPNGTLYLINNKLKRNYFVWKSSKHDSSAIAPRFYVTRGKFIMINNERSFAALTNNDSDNATIVKVLIDKFGLNDINASKKEEMGKWSSVAMPVGDKIVTSLPELTKAIATMDGEITQDRDYFDNFVESMSSKANPKEKEDFAAALLKNLNRYTGKVSVNDEGNIEVKINDIPYYIIIRNHLTFNGIVDKMLARYERLRDELASVANKNPDSFAVGGFSYRGSHGAFLIDQEINRINRAVRARKEDKLKRDDIPLSQRFAELNAIRKAGK